MTRLLAIAAALLALAGAPEASAEPAITLTSPGDFYEGTPFTLGFEFTVVSPQSLTALGVFDDFRNGLSVPATVGLWDESGTLLRSVVVPAGTDAVLVGDFRFVAVTPYPLAPSTHYIVGSYLPFDNASSLGTGQGGSGTVNTVVSVIQDRFSDFNAAFSFPDTTNEHAGGAWLGGNFFVTQTVPRPGPGPGPFRVPEPSTATLAGAAITLLGLVLRRRRSYA